MTRITRLSPQAQSWGDFHCGDDRITQKLVRQAQRSAFGLQVLYGLLGDEGEVLAAMTLRAGELAAPAEILFALGQHELEVPTIHLEVLAVRLGAQGLGIGRAMINFAGELSLTISNQIGVKTLSLEATAESQAFYTRLGFACAASPWPDGTWPMWLTLTA